MNGWRVVDSEASSSSRESRYACQRSFTIAKLVINELKRRKGSFGSENNNNKSLYVCVYGA